MSAAKHTPGPLAVIASASGKPLIVADHPHHDGDVARMARDTPEAWATAALFAAAPELLEACKRFDYFRAALLEREFDRNSPTLIGLLDATRAAIAKARGE